MKKICFLLLLITSLLFVNSANAAPAFIIEQSSVEGQFDLMFRTDTDVTLMGYTFGFTYDVTELSFTSYTNTPPTGFIPDFPAPLNSDTAGVLSDFNALGFSTTITAETGEVQLGSFSFDILDGAVQDGLADFDWYLEYNMLTYNIDGVTFDNSLGSDVRTYLVSGNGLDVGGAAVPIPSSVFLLGTGIIAVLGISRKKN